MEDLDVCLDDITEDEAQEDVNSKAQSGKAAGEDNLPGKYESSKTGDSKNPCHIFQKRWGNERSSEGWQMGLVIKTQKKEDLANCNKWRVITLLSITNKVLSRIILKRRISAIWELFANQ